MAIDLTDFLAESKYTKTIDSYPDGAIYRRTENPAGVNELLAQILQTRFPDYIHAANTKVTRAPAAFGARAEFGGLAGDVIKAGKIMGATRTTEKLSKKGEVYQPYSGPNTDTVMEYLGTLLHEIYHGRADKVGAFGRKLPRDSEGKISPDVKKMLRAADEGGFPSLGKDLFLGDELNEFLATAVTMTDMKERNMQPTGRYAKSAAVLDSLKKEYPWLTDFVNEYRFPELIPAAKR